MEESRDLIRAIIKQAREKRCCGEHDVRLLADSEAVALGIDVSSVNWKRILEIIVKIFAIFMEETPATE